MLSESGLKSSVLKILHAYQNVTEANKAVVPKNDYEQLIRWFKEKRQSVEVSAEEEIVDNLLDSLYALEQLESVEGQRILVFCSMELQKIWSMYSSP